LFTSYTNENPNDIEVLLNDQVSKRRKRRQILSKYQILNLPNILNNETNTTPVYIGVRGNQDINSFSLEFKIGNFTIVNNSAKNNDVISYSIIIFLNIFTIYIF